MHVETHVNNVLMIWHTRGAMREFAEGLLRTVAAVTICESQDAVICLENVSEWMHGDSLDQC